MNLKPLEYYLNLDYGFRVEPDDGCWFAEIKALPGCMTQGDTRKEAIELIESAKRLWIKTAYKRGIRIPLPGEKTRSCIQPQYRIESKPKPQRSLVPSFSWAA